MSGRTTLHRDLHVATKSITLQKEAEILLQKVKKNIASLKHQQDHKMLQSVLKDFKTLDAYRSPFIIQEVEALKTQFLKELVHHMKGYETETDTEPLSRAASAAVPRETRLIRAESLNSRPSAPQGGGRKRALKNKK